MNQFVQHEYDQENKLSNQSTTTMPDFHPSTKNSPLITNQLIALDDKDERYEDAYVVQVIQHWKSKTTDSEQSTDEQPLSSTINTTSTLSNENLSGHTDKNSNKTDLSTIADESEKLTTTTMKKRVTPIPASYIRRRPNVKYDLTLNDSSNPKLLLPNNKPKPGGTGSTTKKSTKSSLVFIAPKKTPPQPHSFSTLSFDDSLQIKRKPILERQTPPTDDQHSLPMTTWTRAPPTSPARSFVQSSGSSFDEESSDESDDESLFLRKKNSQTNNQQSHLIFPTYANIPSAIFITDPSGHSHTFDPNDDLPENSFDNEQIFDKDSIPTDRSTLNVNSKFDISFPPDLELTQPTSPAILDKHTLHSIGEEEEDISDDVNIFSKELNRIEKLSRSRQTNLNVQKKDSNLTQPESEKELLGRRWSDGLIDPEKNQIPSSQSSITKMSSEISITKPTENPPVKISKTKYLLMKLHLTSSNKDDESNTSSINPPKKRTVHRSMDKKHSHSKSSIINNSNADLRSSSNTLVADETAPKQKPTTDNLPPTTNSSHHENLKQKKSDTFGSFRNLDTIDSDDDIDGTFEKAKLGSQLSIASAMSETKARYGLDISGTIELKLTYIITTGALDVLINNCKNLAKAKKDKASDPYVKIYLLPDRSKNSKRKTSVRKTTADPTFEEKFRYHVTRQEFETRVLWISVWSQGSFGHNDFLGEIHLPLATSTLDKTEEYPLSGKMDKNDLTPTADITMDTGELQFQLTFIENPKNKDLGTFQIHYIEGKAIFHGKQQVDAICKAILMPDKVKRRIPQTRKGPSPKWELPLRWDGIRRDNLKNTSVEISIWSQERFRKVMIGFLRLNLAQGHFDNKPVSWLDATKAEKSAWELFLRRPTQVHHFRLPLRPPIIADK